MELTAHQNIERFIKNDFQVKYLILSDSRESEEREFQRYKTSSINSEIQFLKINEKSKFSKILDELLLKNTTFLNYEIHDENISFEDILDKVNYVFITPIKGVLFYKKYLAKYAKRKSIKSIFHTNDCISSYYLGTSLRMIKGYEKITFLGFSYILRYQFIKFLEKKYLKSFDFCMVQTSREKLKLEKLFSTKKNPSPKIIIKENKPVKELLDFSYKPDGLNLVLMSHFIDNRAYSAIWFIKKVWRKVVELFAITHSFAFFILFMRSEFA